MSGGTHEAGASSGMGDTLNGIGNSFIHGGGNTDLTKNDISTLNNIQNLQNTPGMNMDALKQLNTNKDALLHKDNGGYLGALGRIATGGGQTGVETAAGALLPIAANYLRRISMANAYKNTSSNLENQQAQMMNLQRQNMLNGTGFNTK